MKGPGNIGTERLSRGMFVTYAGGWGPIKLFLEACGQDKLDVGHMTAEYAPVGVPQLCSGSMVEYDMEVGNFLFVRVERLHATVLLGLATVACCQRH